MSRDTLHLALRGDGPTLVLLHGWGLHGGIFAPLAERLADRFRVVVPDLPGHGRSRRDATPWTPGAIADRLAGAVAGAAPGPAHWLGWSLGGLLALAVAARRRVASLTLVATPPRFTAGDDWPAAMPRATFDAFASGLDADPEATANRFAGLVAHGDAQRREVRRAIDAVRGDAPSPEALRGGLQLLGNLSLVAETGRLPVAPHWILGGRDALVPAAAADAVAARWPHHRITRFDTAGHAPFLSAPEPFTRLLHELTDG